MTPASPAAIQARQKYVKESMSVFNNARMIPLHVNPGSVLNSLGILKFHNIYLVLTAIVDSTMLSPVLSVVG